MLEELSAWRHCMLEHATITGGETLLDVGCGDGLIAFGAIDRLGEEGLDIFSDISPGFELNPIGVYLKQDR